MSAAVRPLAHRLDKARQIRLEQQNEPVVIDGVHPELCPEIAEIILAQSRMPSTPSLNHGGWKSNEMFLSQRHPAIMALNQKLTEFMGVPSVGWAMVNKNGSEHRRHQHRLAVLSWVYYVTVGDPIVPTIFECRGGLGQLAVEPTVGRIAIFPGEMWHRVPQYIGGIPRISIAGDVRR